MSGLGKKILTSAFNITLSAGIWAGVMAVVDSPHKEQHLYPSLSQPDASKEYHNNIELVAILSGLLTAQSISRSKDRESGLKATPKPT